ncbi:proteasome accessory factor PafA2 [Pseudactinotalea sp. HY160]|uniref:depupylase/deamidase Dop n=1 Tax=Pseudactinotalea sp. HY160 TaxID=2654490 RepID=UPI00131302C4|nr:proteasome accessory factor PafA2 [Pseudactinotalea sp. HY160]
MTVRRIMGIETEYGVVGVGDPWANPMLMSAQLVTAYAAAVGLGRARWDFHDEDPLNDARGFRLDRAAAHPSQLTDGDAGDAGDAADPPQVWGTVTQRRRADEAGRGELTSNVILPNGARYYVDHAHPEYSGPEVTGPGDLVRWDRAGDEILLRSSRLLAQYPGLPPVALYKNNTDGKGASYGTHENYLVDRDVPFADIVSVLTPFLLSRPIFCGAGRVGLGQRGERAGFQLSQRADFIEAEVGLETTLRRPIINTRDEPHADPDRYRRLHVIVGDANLVQPSTLLKAGTISLVLWLLETGGVPPELWNLHLADPVGAASTISHDLTLTAAVPTTDGRELTALEIQRIYLGAVRDRLAAEAARPGAPATDPETAEVMRRWADVLDRLEVDVLSCARDVEWVAKYRLLEGMRTRDGLDWDSPRLAALDLQWSDLRPEKGIYHTLERAGAVEVLVTAEEAAAAISAAPEDTRAYFRGECIRRYGDEIDSANWDAVVFDLPGEENLHRIPMPEPHRGTRAHVHDLLTASPTATDLVAALREASDPGA